MSWSGKITYVKIENQMFIDIEDVLKIRGIIDFQSTDFDIAKKQ